MDIIGQNGNDGLHYEELKNREPLEENDPNPPKK